MDRREDRCPAKGRRRMTRRRVLAGAGAVRRRRCWPPCGPRPPAERADRHRLRRRGAVIVPRLRCVAVDQVPVDGAFTDSARGRGGAALGVTVARCRRPTASVWRHGPARHRLRRPREHPLDHRRLGGQRHRRRRALLREGRAVAGGCRSISACREASRSAYRRPARTRARVDADRRCDDDAVPGPSSQPSPPVGSGARGRAVGAALALQVEQCRRADAGASSSLTRVVTILEEPSIEEHAAARPPTSRNR